ncbi:hypothetical protein [Phycicoccus jejuensis]|uniref:hypothetical protein n=1 Tax=Phycicoccus jejuensis TaxID=367299 RepID=UPI0004C2B632|nr:hypothetical protein [Phycicoccus jejuensis]
MAGAFRPPRRRASGSGAGRPTGDDLVVVDLAGLDEAERAVQPRRAGFGRLVGEREAGGSGLGPAELGEARYLFLNQLPVVLTALVLAVVLASPVLPWAGRVAAWTAAAAVVLVLVGARLVIGWSTASDVVLGLGVGLAWAALLASAVRPPTAPADAGVTEPAVAPRTLDGP